MQETRSPRHPLVRPQPEPRLACSPQVVESRGPAGVVAAVMSRCSQIGWTRGGARAARVRRHDAGAAYRSRMALNPDAVGSTSEPVEVSWNSKDALLYAVGIGAGHEDLAFTTENSSGVDQLVFPTFPVVIGWGRGSAMGNVGTFDPAQLVHGQQAVTLHRPIPVSGTVTSPARSSACTTRARPRSSTPPPATLDGEPLYTNTSSVFIRGEGGWGGERGSSGPQNVPPTGPRPRGRLVTSPRPGVRVPAVRRPQPAAHRPGVRCDRWIRHADPARAVHLRLHRSGVAPRAVRRRSSRFQHIEARFASPVFPATRSRSRCGRRDGEARVHHERRRRRDRATSSSTRASSATPDAARLLPSAPGDAPRAPVVSAPVRRRRGGRRRRRVRRRGARRSDGP